MNETATGMNSEPMLGTSHAMETITRAARDGAADAREMANRVWANAGLFFCRFVYTTSYTISYGVVLPGDAPRPLRALGQRRRPRPDRWAPPPRPRRSTNSAATIFRPRSRPSLLLDPADAPARRLPEGCGGHTTPGRMLLARLASPCEAARAGWRDQLAAFFFLKTGAIFEATPFSWSP